MEFILENTNIFDKECVNKIDNLIKKNKNLFKSNCYYNMTFMYSNEILKDKDSVVFKDSIIHEAKDKNLKNDDEILKYIFNLQLHNFSKICDKNNINGYMFYIWGANIEKLSIKISIEETEKNTSKSVGKVFSVIPDIDSTRKMISDVYGENLVKIFYKYMSTIDDKEIVANVLKISNEEDERALGREFCKQYWELGSFYHDEKFEIAKNELIEKTTNEMTKKYGSIT